MSFKQIGRSLCSWSKKDLASLLIAGALAPMAAGIKDAKAMDADEAFTQDFMSQIETYGYDDPVLDTSGKGHHSVRIYTGRKNGPAPQGSILFTVYDDNKLHGSGDIVIFGKKIHTEMGGSIGHDESPGEYTMVRMNFVSFRSQDGAIDMTKDTREEKRSTFLEKFFLACRLIHIALYGPPGVDTSKKVEVKNPPKQVTAADKTHAGTATGKPEARKTAKKPPVVVDRVVPF